MAENDANNEALYYNDGNASVVCPAWAPIVGFTGITAAVVFASTFFTVCVLVFDMARYSCIAILATIDDC
jgi:hypothetical protein